MDLLASMDVSQIIWSPARVKTYRPRRAGIFKRKKRSGIITIVSKQTINDNSLFEFWNVETSPDILLFRFLKKRTEFLCSA